MSQMKGQDKTPEKQPKKNQNEDTQSLRCRLQNSENCRKIENIKNEIREQLEMKNTITEIHWKESIAD